MRVVVRDGAEPYRSATRKYPDMQRAFLREYVRELEENGLVVRNNQSRWASAAHPVRKQGTNEYRITVDYRQVNQRTVPLAGSTPNLAAVTQCVRGAYGFGKFDFFKGFWQLPLDPDCREMYSFVTEDGVFTPTRVPQGAADSALHFQAQMHDCFREQLYQSVLIWIDDVLLWASSPGDFIERLRVFFAILRQRNLKLNAKKCKLFAPKVVWCGKLIDGEGIEHDPARLEALGHMPLPPTAAALQNFLCAVNWLRDSMVDYARTVGPLQAKLEAVMAERGRKKTQLAGVDLPWSKDDEAAFRVVLKLLETSTKQYFVDPAATVCLFTDASNDGWAVVLTQVKEWDAHAPVTDQGHELLVCRGGAFKNAELSWSVIEKEAYPIVRACADLSYLLERENGFEIFCDHSNLVQIFSPNKEVKQHVKGKLQRWALRMIGLRYRIQHIRGEDNVWADIVSRWGQGFGIHEPFEAVKRVTTRSTVAATLLRPLQDVSFVWPTGSEIRSEQNSYPRPTNAVDEDGLWRVDGRVWIPSGCTGLIQRLLVIAHSGPQGHRGERVMLAALRSRFEIARVGTLVSRFVRECLLCKHVKGGHLLLRPWSEGTMASKRNECLHFDFLYLGEDYGTSRYLLVLKDELTHYCELVPADTPTSMVAAEAILDWFKRFGRPEMWISDSVSHFKAQLMATLAERLHAVQKFTPVYSPWINGTVERVNRDILQVFRAMLMELQLDTRNWVYLLPVVQANLNHAPVESLGEHAPIELFTGLPAPSLLDTVVLPAPSAPRVLAVDLDRVGPQLAKLRADLHAMHAHVVNKKERKRLYEMARHKGTVCNFTVGDFVLWSRVDERMRGGKLLVRWVGPFKVTQALSHSYIITHLLTGAEYDVHGSRLKFFHDADLDVTAELRQHVANQGLVLGVREIVAHRFNRQAGAWELNVAWRGLEDAENSWELSAALLRDVPVLVREYATAQDDAEFLASLAL
jgi:transposase InsO family protein